MGGKRARKKLAKQRNNAKIKQTPFPDAGDAEKRVPGEALASEGYREEFVRWTAREIDAIPGNDGRRWDLSASESVELLKFLDEVTSKKWKDCLAETVMSGRKKRARNHDQAIESLSKEAQKRLSELPAVEERLFRFRLSGETRLWGFRSGALFRILWYDPEHQVSPVSLRNT
ncbi:Uncharacterised protein [Corynebacterium imitans]|uniref:Uncharacterized protein n=1 Tax=Corynebacterium imitans TaxID=156978 RepID=A0A240A442_9CORY|nr:hypothetical protein [Corynebacterium imitans]SNV77844.1 Uncharacterised protein [Corynebacterium imitans]